MLTFLAHLRNLVARPLRHDDRGVTAVEYGLIIVLIAIAIVGTLTILGTTISGVFTTITGSL
jgi:pilus assembly protein Flp/PilA